MHSLTGWRLAAVMAAWALACGAGCGSSGTRTGAGSGTRPAGSTARPATAPATTPATTAADVWKPGQVYLVHRARGPVTIDQKDHPDQWAGATVIRDFITPIEHHPAEEKTEFWMLWDDENLYVRFVAHDSDLRGTLTGKLPRVWTEDAVELFLSPDYDKGSYYELELAPHNALLALRILDKRRGTFEERGQWDHHIRTAVAAEGTINKPDDTDRYYRGLMAIPFADLDFAGGKPPKVGDAWRFNVPRCNLSKRFGDRQELSACVPLPKIDFHLSDDYATLRFEK